MVEPLTAKDLRKTCDDETFGCITTAEVQSLEAIIGQERALSALKFGLGIKSKGFNIFVAGRPGTGRTTAVRKFLEEEAKSRPVPWDWVYVNNFKDTFYPKALSLPPGRAKVFQENLKKLIDVVVQEIRNAFESDDYAENRKKTLIIFQHQKEALLKKVNEKAYAQGFAIQSSPMGVLTIPLLDGKPISDEDFMALDPQKKEEIKEKQKQLQNELESIFVFPEIWIRKLLRRCKNWIKKLPCLPSNT